MPPSADDIPVPHSTVPASAHERVLLIEPAGPLRDSLAQALRSQGFLTEAVGIPENALELVRSWTPRLVLLDVALLVDGNLEICRQICELAEGPVVLLPSVRGARSVLVDSESDTGRDLALLRAVHSLTGRVSAVESKAKPDGAVKQETLEIGPIAIEQAKRTVYVRGQNAHISSKLEYELLLALVSPAGQIRTRDELLDGVWGDHRPEYPKTLDVHIKRLRKKLELEPRNPKLIVTVRGVGFYFDADATSHT